VYKICIVLVLACIAAMNATVVAAPDVTVVMPGEEHWVPQSDHSTMAVLYGNPDGSGFYVVRIKVPPNWSFPAHYHPMRENVTVISGTFYVGLGTTLDKSNATAYPAGSFVSLPAKVPHYALTRSTGAVIQLEGIGPFDTVMIHK
jgi:uncharacterized RmlC-like cupin family protein